MFRYLLALLLFTSCGESKPRLQVADGANALRVELIADSVVRISDTLRLGRVYQGEVVDGSFWVWNSSDTPVVLTNVVTGCGCTTTQWDSKPIVAKVGEQLLKFRFDSKGRSGYQLKAIDVVASDYRVARILIEAEVITN